MHLSKLLSITVYAVFEWRLIICGPYVWADEPVTVWYDPNLQIEDLEAWINEKEIIAGLQDIGQDFDHVQASIYQSAKVILIK